MYLVAKIFDISILKNTIIEACVETLEEALKAEALGAQQIELCARLDLGGLTPDNATVANVLDQCRCKVKIMIRPRAGDFIYSAKELQQMKAEISWCKSLGVNDIVLGILTSDQCIDLPSLKELATIAAPMQITFHKAIDEVQHPLEAIDQLKKIPQVKFILSSGSQETAWTGRNLLKKMQARAGQDIQIIAAGKVRAHNLQKLHGFLNFNYYHGRNLTPPK